ncbi:MAG: LysR family transcriptional regulator [Rhizobiales bacterium]|nr:LysR family transcriptional regulator [Hyphomicrobiales bacterium]
MDIRQFRNMLAVMEAGSLNRAAHQLGISQPALTKSIQRLEAQLNVPLFTRESRGMSPTIYAESLRPYAQAACVGMAQSVNEIEALKSGSSGVITLAGPPVIAQALFPQALIRLVRERPNLQVRVVVEVDDLYASLLAGRYDMLAATISRMPPEFGLQQRVLFEDPLVLATRPNHPLTRLRKVTLRELQSQRWIFPAAENLHRRRLEHAFAAAHLPLPRATIECRSPELIKSMVQQSDYVGLIPKLAIQSEVSEGKLGAIEIDSPFMIRTIGLIWRDHHSLSPAARALMDAIESICRERGYAGAESPSVPPRER